MADTVVSIAANSVVKIVDLALFVKERIDQMKFNDRERKQLLSNVENLQSILKEIDSSKRPPSHNIQRVLDDIERNLTDCASICGDIDKQTKEKQFLWSAPQNQKEVALLKQQIQNCITLASACISVASHASSQESFKRIEGAARNPSGGVYPVSGSALKPPEKIGKPVCDCEGPNILGVSWTDRSNPPGCRIDFYEILYDEQNGLRIKVDGSTTRCCKIERDSVLSIAGPGPVYSIRVRGVNKRGPGDWSEATVCHFEQSLPERPQVPLNFEVDTTTITLKVNKPIEQKLRILVQYTDSINKSKWTTKTVDLSKLEILEDKKSESDGATKKKKNSATNEKRGVESSVTTTVEKKDGFINFKGKIAVQLVLWNLDPDTTYYTRMILQNKSGQSKTSEILPITTYSIPPGRPVGLRASSYRTSNTLKIRWIEPEMNPHQVLLVHHYEVDWGKREWRKKCINEPITMVKKLSAKFTKLKSNTCFWFRVRAVNRKGRASEYTEEIKIETKMIGGGARRVKAIAAGVGTGMLMTVLSPVFTGAALGIIAGGAAVVDVEEKERKGKYAAGAAAGIAAGVGGTALGTIGAPVIGAAMGYGVGKMIMEEDISDQSDEDEEDEEDVNESNTQCTADNMEKEEDEQYEEAEQELHEYYDECTNENHDEAEYYEEDEYFADNEQPDNRRDSNTCSMGQPQSVYMNELQLRLARLGKK